ncbi:hypothetical protein BS47DRAFT_1394099 [Hydnum rufescens UP504]|uniref:Uncharacterized protein n=1 Tax=Hydnum rufescens UP504 TaxID=1448309 RepID=A0A9P6DVB5_9AGAM|nr:hypothetical protein BS47DRAFT_1394099 [Hydnum rufescens UP504]
MSVRDVTELWDVVQHQRFVGGRHRRSIRGAEGYSEVAANSEGFEVEITPLLRPRTPPPPEVMRHTLSGEFVNPLGRKGILRRWFRKIREFHFSRSQTAFVNATPVSNVRLSLTVPLRGSKDATIVINVATEEEHDKDPPAPHPKVLAEYNDNPSYLAQAPFSVQHELDRTIVLQDPPMPRPRPHRSRGSVPKPIPESKRPRPVVLGPAQVDAEDGIAEKNLPKNSIPRHDMHHGGNTDCQFHVHSSPSFSCCIILSILALLIVSVLDYHHSWAVAAVSHKIELAKSNFINSHHAFEQATLVAGASTMNAKIVERHADVAVEVAKIGAQWASKCVELATQRLTTELAATSEYPSAPLMDLQYL